MINFYDGQVIPEADATVDVVAFFFPAPSRSACGALNTQPTKHATKASQCMSVAVDVREAARRSRKWIFVLEDTAHGRSTKGRYARGPTALSAARA